MSEHFYDKKKTMSPSYDIGITCDHEITLGEIGIEIEVEGNKFQKNNLPSQWKYHEDHSLRGKDNAEYVLNKPIMFSDVPKAVDDIFAMMKKYGSVLDESNRTSVHVHLNVQRFHLNRLCAFISLYLAVEELLTAWCGEHRVGNLFCLRAKDAPAIVSIMKQYLISDGKSSIPDGMHYAGLNCKAIHKFGSLEVRSLRGPTDPKVILDWVSILERIYKLSSEYPDPRAIVENFSGYGAMDFLQNILGDKTALVLENIPFNNQQVMESMYTGIRYAQDLCYCRDWTLYKPVETSIDPFGRINKSKKGAGGITPVSIAQLNGPSTGAHPLTFYNSNLSNSPSPHLHHQLEEAYGNMTTEQQEEFDEYLQQQAEDNNAYEEEQQEENY